MLEIELPSGRSDVVLTHVLTGHMMQIYNAQKYELPEMFVGAIQKLINVDIKTLFLEDFRYLLAMIDKISWTESHRIYEWRCVRPYYVTYDNERHMERPVGRRYDVVDCNSLNTEEIPRIKLTMGKWRTLPYGMRHPTVGRWLEAQKLSETEGDICFDAMWADSDLPLSQTIDLLSPSDLMEIRMHKYVICELSVNFRCNTCLRRYTYDHALNLLNFLRVYSEQSMMNMTNDMAVHRKIFCPDDMPLNKLLYWHGLLVKELQKKAEDKQKRDAISRGRS